MTHVGRTSIKNYYHPAKESFVAKSSRGEVIVSSSLVWLFKVIGDDLSSPFIYEDPVTWTIGEEGAFSAPASPES